LLRGSCLRREPWGERVRLSAKKDEIAGPTGRLAGEYINVEDSGRNGLQERGPVCARLASRKGFLFRFSAAACRQEAGAAPWGRRS